jgi:hypothetical protein
VFFCLGTLQIRPLDYAHSRPATQRPRFPGQLGRNCPEVFRESRDCQPGLIENVVQPSEADFGLEGFLCVCAILVDGREQRRNDLGEAGGCGRGGGRRSLGAVRSYLDFSARCKSEALNCR